jgi:hypothetical protein
MVKERSMRSVVIHDVRELVYYEGLVKEDVDKDGVTKAGDRCESLEVCIEEVYDPDLLANLLVHTPNLSVFLLRTLQRSRRVGLLPRPILDAVLNKGPRLRCLYLDSIAESPAFFHLLEIADQLTCLHTLHVRSIHSYPDVPSFFTKKVDFRWTFPIKVLSLGFVSSSVDDSPVGFTSGWDKLMTLLSSASISLPNIHRLDVPAFPSTLFFFQKYGHRLRILLTTSCGSEFTLSPALEYCTSLESLILQLCDKVPYLARLPSSLRRICVAPCYDGPSWEAQPGPMPYLTGCIDEFFCSLQNIDLSNLEEVRIRNAGEMIRFPHQTEFLRDWSRVWWRNGIRMVDRGGASIWDDNSWVVLLFAYFFYSSMATVFSFPENRSCTVLSFELPFRTFHPSSLLSCSYHYFILFFIRLISSYL